MKRAAVALLTVLALAGCEPRQGPTYVTPTEAPTVVTAEPTADATTEPELLPESATAVDAGDGIPCKDGTISHATHRKGACSHHGGIE